MTLVKAIRRLRRKPILVLVALLFACAVGGALFTSQSTVGVASAVALVDSSKSQVADLGDSSGASVGTLAYRASLLASLMVNPPIKDQIARAAGLASADLTATGPSPVGGAGAAGASAPSAPAAGSGPNASTLTASVPTLPAGQLPVIQVSTQAPTPAIAAKLANGAFTALEAEISSVAGTNGISLPQRVVIRQLGDASASWSSQGPGMALSVIGAIVAFVLGCAVILGMSALRTALREEAAREREPRLAREPATYAHPRDRDLDLDRDRDRDFDRDFDQDPGFPPEPAPPIHLPLRAPAHLPRPEVVPEPHASPAQAAPAPVPAAQAPAPVLPVPLPAAASAPDHHDPRVGAPSPWLTRVAAAGLRRSSGRWLGGANGSPRSGRRP